VTAYTQKDYEAIEGAVLESPRGRWFLGEFARRNRAADTLMLLEAIRKLERGVAEAPAHQLSADLAAELQDLSEFVASTIDRGAELPTAVDQLARVKEKIDGLLARRCDMAQGELTGENLSFFAGDEDLFETAPAANAPSLSVVGEQQERTVPPRKPAEAPKGDPKDRIVFIRRGSSRETSIPLADEAEAAAGSQPGS
jgi:pimeloyl-ACP methyl ester carboxylesterase